MQKYDYIITGTGASGLMLVYQMLTDGFFDQKQILLIDKEIKNQNDRTWCFWEEGKGDFEAIIHKTWLKIFFAGENLKKSFPIHPYQYKMVKGIDFYNYYLTLLKQYSNITLVNDKVISLKHQDENVLVKTETKTYETKQVFNSIFKYEDVNHQSKYPILQQHFLGWFIKTEQSIFTKDEATFMDFSLPQKGNTRFMYVLPFSENEALVEYTLFSEKPLNKSEYEEVVEKYLADKNSGSYEILETEKGNIPMTCYDFEQHNSEHIFHIGTAGGWAKASTGYTFMKTHKNVKALITHLTMGASPLSFKTKSRFWYYDLLLLDILYKNNHLGRSIFEAMFKKRNPQTILKFLDEETTFLEELKIIWACPKWPFMKAFINRVLNRSTH